MCEHQVREGTQIVPRQGRDRHEDLTRECDLPEEELNPRKPKEALTPTEQHRLDEPGGDGPLAQTRMELTGVVEGDIAKQWFVECLVNGRPQQMLVDTGCSVTMIDTRAYEQNQDKPSTLEGDRRSYNSVTGDTLEVQGTETMTLELGGTRNIFKKN